MSYKFIPSTISMAVALALPASFFGVTNAQDANAQDAVEATVKTVPITSTDGADVKTTAIAADFKMKRCVNMGNYLETPKGQTWGGEPYGEADYKRISAAGFDTVRIPIRWTAYTGPAPDYKVDEDFMAKAMINVKWALDANLNVIINIHHFDEIMEKPTDNFDQYIAVWKELSAAFAHAPDNVWFETLNEPHKNLSGKLMRQTQLIALKIIRAKNPKRIVIFGGENWSGLKSLGSNASTDDPNVVYTFHYYDPFDFTHQKASWLGDDMPKAKRGWGSKEDRKRLSDDVKMAVAFRDAVKRPVFVGEFGANDPINSTDRVKFATGVSKELEAANMPWCLWAYGNTFKLYDKNKGWDKPMLRALTGSTLAE